MSSGVRLKDGRGSDSFSRIWSCSISWPWFAPCWRHSQASSVHAVARWPRAAPGSHPPSFKSRQKKKKSLFSNYLQLGPIGQAWNTGFHQGQEWGQPLSHSEWLLEDNHSATTRRRGDARWAQVWRWLYWDESGFRAWEIRLNLTFLWILIMFYFKKFMWILLHNMHFYVQCF